MALSKSQHANFRTLINAVRDDAVVLVECQLRSTGASVPVVAATNASGEEIEIVPLALLCDEDPYEILNPPNPDGGFFGETLDPWSEDNEFPVEDWAHEVSDDSTRLSYWDWVKSQREAYEDEEFVDQER